MIEYKYTANDLKQMQGWSLERKIQVSQSKIIQFYEHFKGKCYISFSGGKDSSCLLDLARRCYPNMEAVYVDTQLEFPEVRKFALSHKNVTTVKPEMRFNEVIQKYGWCYPSKDIAKDIYSAKRGKEWALNRFKGLNADGTESHFKRTRYIKWAYLLDSPFMLSDKCCGIMKEKPLSS